MRDIVAGENVEAAKVMQAKKTLRTFKMPR